MGTPAETVSTVFPDFAMETVKTVSHNVTAFHRVEARCDEKDF
jgi:hypothetical protein